MTDAYVERRRVDPSGAITGLDDAKGRDILLIKLPDMDEVQRKAEADAERLARDLNWDPEKARGLVRDTADGARSLAQSMERAWNKLLSPVEVARESAEEKQALADVAKAAKTGQADWGPTADRDASSERGGGAGPGGDLSRLP